VSSLWADTAAPLTIPEAPLPSSAEVAIIGAGYTGLWTAYYLRRSGLDVAVVEAERVGFGASGRNGGWCSALYPVREPAMEKALRDTVEEVGRVITAEGIDCDWAYGGTLALARTPRQLRLARAESGFLSANEAAKRCGATRVLGATYSPHCAALHPLKLARGLARGLPVHERTRALAIEPGRVITDRGEIRARYVVRATEAYTPGRTVVPVYSLMIATAPLPPSTWDEIGLRERETFTDLRRLVIYGQRTAEGRLAFGGRGAPYHFGSRIDVAFDLNDRVHAALQSTLIDLFPQLEGVPITHRWGGPLGIHRDWHPSVGLDRATGIGWAGGYVGDGVAASNLAGRTLADLITGRVSEITRLPWVNRRSRRWAPEPLRWLGINAALRGVYLLDRLRP
jgi:glycine/D-amino acid oxidase-like deaminating enzyme